MKTSAISLQSNKQRNSSLQTKGPYNVEEIIGHGTFGKVFSAVHQKTNQRVALKHVFQNKKYKNRELQILQSIKHPYIVELYNSFYEQRVEGTYLNLAMQYVPETLSKILKKKLSSKQFLDNKLVIKYAYCLINALAYLNNKGICHRDIKPSNILINSQNEAKICDFGSAKMLVLGQKNLSYICSRYYRAPELIFGQTQYSTKIDMWSLGCVLGEMLINLPLFDGSNSMGQLIKIIKILGSPTEDDIKGMKLEKLDIELVKAQGTKISNKIIKTNSKADPELISLIQKMLCYNPQTRISAADALKLPIFDKIKAQGLQQKINDQNLQLN